jgi:hypothetical protein
MSSPTPPSSVRQVKYEQVALKMVVKNPHGISERMILQELLDRGASCDEAGAVVERLARSSQVKQDSMHFLTPLSA